MAVTGDAGHWSSSFPAHLVPQIVELVVDSWTTFPKPGVSDGEVPITTRFRAHLVTRKNALRALPVRIDRESVEDDFNSGTERGRIDIRFTHASSCREDVYFALECKRLNVRTKTMRCRALAKEYVSQGVARFASSQYAQGHRHAGMIGYVLDGRVHVAERAINRALVRVVQPLHLQVPHQLSASSISQRPNIRETRHRIDRRILVLQHLFLPSR